MIYFCIFMVSIDFVISCLWIKRFFSLTVRLIAWGRKRRSMILCFFGISQFVSLLLELHLDQEYPHKQDHHAHLQMQICCDLMGKCPQSGILLLRFQLLLRKQFSNVCQNNFLKIMRFQILLALLSVCILQTTKKCMIAGLKPISHMGRPLNENNVTITKIFIST